MFADFESQFLLSRLQLLTQRLVSEQVFVLLPQPFVLVVTHDLLAPQVLIRQQQ
jgi:hypothetical protein